MKTHTVGEGQFVEFIYTRVKAFLDYDFVKNFASNECIFDFLFFNLKK